MPTFTSGATITDSSQLAANTVTATQLATDAVETAKIKNAQVTLAKLATDAIPRYIKVSSVTVGVGGAGSVDFSSLDINGATGGEYLIIGRVPAAGIDGCYVYINADRTATHYNHTRAFSTAGTYSGEAANNALIGGNVNATTGAIIEILVTRSPTGYAIMRAFTWATGGSQMCLGCSQKDDATVANITAIGIDSLTASWPQNTVFTLYRSTT